MTFMTENGRQISDIDTIKLRIASKAFGQNYSVYSKNNFPITGHIEENAKISDIIKLTATEWNKT